MGGSNLVLINCTPPINNKTKRDIQSNIPRYSPFLSTNPTPFLTLLKVLPSTNMRGEVGISLRDILLEGPNSITTPSPLLTLVGVTEAGGIVSSANVRALFRVCNHSLFHILNKLRKKKKGREQYIPQYQQQ